jgi:hypothetical protein
MTMRHLAIILCVLAIGPAQAANTPIYQSGLIPPGHALMAITNGVAGDAGSALAGNLTELGITNTGTPFCINDASYLGKYHQFCLGANALGGGLISYNAYGGALPLPLQFNINGVTATLPAASGNPGTALIVDPKLFSSAAPATLQPVVEWTPCVWPQSGCVNAFGYHGLSWLDQDPLWNADFATVQTDSGALATIVQFTGTPTNAEAITGTWTVPGQAGSPFTISYTMTGADTLHSTALNWCTQMLATAGLSTALKNYRYTGQISNWGYQPLPAPASCALQTPANKIIMDIPIGTTLAVSSSAHVTVVVGGLNRTDPGLDGYPAIQSAGIRPGYTPSQGDLAGAFNISGQVGSSSTGPDKVVSDWQGIYNGTYSTGSFWTTSGSGNNSLAGIGEAAGNVAPRFQVGDGLFCWNPNSVVGFGDQGTGSFSCPDIVFKTLWGGTTTGGGGAGGPQTRDSAPTIYKDASNHTIFQGQSGSEATLTVSGSTGGVGVTASQVMLQTPTVMGSAISFTLAPLALSSLNAITCNSGTKGNKYLVTDINTGTPTFHAAASTYSGGGSDSLPFTCDGTTWRSM